MTAPAFIAHDNPTVTGLLLIAHRRATRSIDSVQFCEDAAAIARTNHINPEIVLAELADAVHLLQLREHCDRDPVGYAAKHMLRIPAGGVDAFRDGECGVLVADVRSNLECLVHNAQIRAAS